MKLKLLAVAVAAAITTPAAFAESSSSVKAGKGITVETGDTSLNIGGRLQFDLDYFDGDAFASGDTSGSDSEIRRARLFAKGKVGKNWEAKLRADFKEDGTTKFDEAYLKYKGWDFADLTIGTHKANFGLEQVTSSKDITAIERTMATNAFTIGNKKGIALGKGTNDYTWGLGVYDLGDEGDHIATAVTGRFTFSPVNTKEEIFHLGAGFTKQRLANDEFKNADQRLEIHLADEKVGSGTIVGQSFSGYNLEVAYAAGPFHAQGEYYDGEVDGVTDTDLTGYYAQVGYIITGESRPYSKGKFKRVKPKGKDGAWEVFGRWSSYEPGTDEAEALTLGLNYYANNAIRVGLNYVMGDLTEGGVNKDGNAFAVRVQYVF